MSKKPRSDAKLKGLPAEKQEQIVQWAMTPKSESCVGGLAYALEMLRADGVRISRSNLAEFVSWWRLERRFSSASDRAAQFEARLLQDGDFSPERARAAGQALFTMEAMDSGDVKAFVALESLRLDQESALTRGRLEKEKLSLAREKFELLACERFLQWHGNRKARRIADSAVSNAEKIAALRKEFFKDVDELEGSVELPQ